MATLGGTTLTNLTQSDASEVFVGKQEQSHNGTTLTDYTNIKLAFSLKCELLTEAQRDAIKTKADVVTSQTFVDVDGNSYTTVVRRGTWRDTRLPGGTGNPLYSVEFELEEAV